MILDQFCPILLIGHSSTIDSLHVSTHFSVGGWGLALCCVSESTIAENDCSFTILSVPGVVGKSGEVILIGAGLKEAKKKRGLAATTK